MALPGNMTIAAHVRRPKILFIISPLQINARHWFRVSDATKPFGPQKPICHPAIRVLRRLLTSCDTSAEFISRSWMLSDKALSAAPPAPPTDCWRLASVTPLE
jgi:hypothetical protein